MSVLIEGLTLIANRAGLDAEFQGGSQGFIGSANLLVEPPTFVSGSDPHLVSLGFRDNVHVKDAVALLEDVNVAWVMFDAEFGPLAPVDWLKWSSRNGVTRAWLVGTRPGKLSMSSGVLRLAVEDGVETLLDLATGAQIRHELPQEGSETPIHDALLEAIEAIGWTRHYDNAPFAIVDMMGETGLYSNKFYANEVGKLVTCFTRAPLIVPVAARRRTMEFITRANYGMFRGSFEFSLDEGVLGFRASIDVCASRLEEQAVLAVLSYNMNTIDRYTPLLMQVIYGKRHVAEAVAAAEV